MNREKLHRSIHRITSLLAEKSYAEIERRTGGIRLVGDDLKEAVADYGREIVPAPPGGYDQLNIVEVSGRNPREWHVYVPIYTKEEGRSDLTLELTVIDSDSDLYTVQIDSLHVL